MNLFLLGAVGASLLAQSDDEIIVEATRLNTDLSETTAAATVIDTNDIELTQSSFLVETLTGLPGVTTASNGAFGGQTSVRLRGASTGQTLVLIDGVSVGDVASPGGGFDFGLMDPFGIERVEVLRGPQSVLWGTDAIGGIVSITTKDGSATERRARIEAGSFGERRVAVGLAEAGENGGARISASYITADGLSKADEADGNVEDDGYTALSLRAAGQYELSDHVRLNARLRYVDADIEFDGFPPPQFALADSDENTKSEDISAVIGAEFGTDGGRWHHDLQASWARLDRQNFAAGVPSFGTKGDRLGARFATTFNRSENTRFAFGVETETQSVDDEDVSIIDGFALAQSALTERLGVSAGLRLTSHETFDEHLVAQVGGRFALTSELDLRASWGQGFKAPTLFQLNAAFGIDPPNRDLQPEIANGVDAGLVWTHKDGVASAELTVFATDIEDQIDFSFVTSNYQNVAIVESQGVEFATSVALSDTLAVDLSHTYTDAVDGDGNALLRIPDHRSRLAIDWQPTPKARLGVITHYTDDIIDVETTVDSWTRVDLTGRFQLSDRVALVTRVENIFDKDYQQLAGYGTPGISGRVGIDIGK